MIPPIAWVYIMVPVALSLLVNLIVYLQGWAQQDSKASTNTYLPPGYVVGTIWVIIFALLGYLIFLVKDNMVSLIIIVIFLVYSLAYPFMTPRIFPLLNLWALILAFVMLAVLLVNHVYEQKNIIILLTPLILWASYVNTIYAI